MTGVPDLVGEIRAAFGQGQTPQFRDVDLKYWPEALDRLLDEGELTLVECIARALLDLRPDLGFARSLCTMFDRLPAIGQDDFKDDIARDLQIIRKRDADVVLLVFCGLNHRPGMPLPLIHRWLARLPAHLIYLRDFQRLCFLDGIGSLGNRQSSLTALRRILNSLGPMRLACLGVSAGGFPALRYGLDLGADAVLSLAGMPNLTPEFNSHLRFAGIAARLRDRLPGAELDLRPLYMSAPRVPRSLFVYGDSNWDDRIQSESMLGVPSAAFLPLANYSWHLVFVEMIRLNLFGDVLKWAIGDGPLESARFADKKAS